MKHTHRRGGCAVCTRRGPEPVRESWVWPWLAVFAVGYVGAAAVVAYQVHIIIEALS